MALAQNPATRTGPEHRSSYSRVGAHALAYLPGPKRQRSSANWEGLEEADRRALGDIDADAKAFVANTEWASPVLGRWMSFDALPIRFQPVRAQLNCSAPGSQRDDFKRWQDI